MLKENIKFVENKIKEYFTIEEKIKLLKNLIISLEEKKEIVEDKIKNLKIDFNIDIKSITIDSMPKCNGDGSSYFERNIIKQIQDNENMILNIEDKIFSYKEEILKLEFKNQQMKYILNFLKEEYKKMLVQRYKEKMTEITIANNLNVSIQQYHKLKKIAIENIYNMIILENI
ncbi:hypothetical protein [uncultured Tyzzerella sp.]|uniref:hypothetical protein n=1 Tax=uncultured Tyzzerella sp. TaxID=2321398 RepID=UPI0029421FC4|nr:hypothetical protein [uncultured Tyzzerella sp.]